MASGRRPPRHSRLRRRRDADKNRGNPSLGPQGDPKHPDPISARRRQPARSGHGRRPLIASARAIEALYEKCGLDKTKDDTEQWSFLFRTEGSVGHVYSPWAEYEDREFDGGLYQLDLLWTLERRDELTSGRADPTAQELHEWREASCRWASNYTDWCYPACIVSLRPRGLQVKGYALFLCQYDSPVLEGIYESVEEAKIALVRIGSMRLPVLWHRTSL
jgi:hypothetical protein